MATQVTVGGRASSFLRRSGLLLALGLMLAGGLPELSTDPVLHTFSVICRDPYNGDFGVAVVSKFKDVGTLSPFAKANVGAVVTQLQNRETHGPEGLALLEKGKSAKSVVDDLIKDDEGQKSRQLGVIGARGNPWVFTGRAAPDYSGHKAGGHWAVLGNCLASKKVIEEMARAFVETEGSLAGRMVASLRGATKEGGDKRGHRSAGLIVASERSGDKQYLIQLLVGDDANPVETLAKKFAEECTEWFDIGDRYLGKDQTGGDVLVLEQVLKQEGFFQGEPDPVFDDETVEALKAYQGGNGLLKSGRVDRPTQEKLWKIRTKMLKAQSKEKKKKEKAPGTGGEEEQGEEQEEPPEEEK